MLKRLKPIFFASTLGQFPQFFAGFTHEFYDYTIDEETQPLMEDMHRMFPPLRQGYPWSKWGAEQVLRHGRTKGLIAAIFRLPNTYIAWNTGYTNKTDYATALTISSIIEGIFPMSTAMAPLTPVDVICQLLVKAAFNPKRKHWLYNILDDRRLHRKDIEDWSRDLGVSYRGTDVEEFFAAVRARGPSSPVFRFVPLMAYWAKYWFSDKERTGMFPVRTQNIFDDTVGIHWPSQRSIFANSVIYCMQSGYFPSYSKSLTTTVQGAVEAASAMCGLEEIDEGTMNMSLEAFHIIRASLLDQCGPTFAGLLGSFRTTRGYLTNLMVMHELERTTPAIREQSVDPPIVIVGLNRSGTTFLQYLMAHDPSNRAIRACEMLLPFGLRGDYRPHDLPNIVFESEWASDPRIETAQEVLDTQLGAISEWEGIHSQKATAPEEEFMILEHLGRCYSLCSAFNVPDYRKWILADDCREMAKAYPFHRRFLQHLQWQRRGKRWLLKMPFHLFCLDALFETYPDAKVIFMHRDPTEVIASWCSLCHFARSSLTTGEDLMRTGTEELETMAYMMKRALHFRQSRPDLADRFVDINYTDLVSDAESTVRKVYERLGETLTEKALENMRWYIAANQEKRKTVQKHQYDMKDYGLTHERIKQQFEEYYAAGYLNKN